MRSYPGLRTPLPFAPRSLRPSHQGYLSRMATKYPSPLALYPAIGRALVAKMRHRKPRRHIFNFVLSLLVVATLLLGPFAQSPYLPSPASVNAARANTSAASVSPEITNSSSTNNTQHGQPQKDKGSAISTTPRQSTGANQQPKAPLGGEITWEKVLGDGNPSGMKHCADCGQPVNTATGNFWHSFTDLSIPGRSLPLLFERTYNSLAAVNWGGQVGQYPQLGYGWTFNYNMYITSGLYTCHYYQENGSLAVFEGYWPNWIFATASCSRFSSPATLTRDQGQTTYIYVARDCCNWRLDKIVDRNILTTTLTYDNQDRLTTVTDPMSRSLTLSYTDTNHPTFITSVSDPANRTIHFTYDTNNDLVSSTDVGGKVTSYTYDSSHRMLTMTDPNSGVVRNAYDTASRVISQTDALNRNLQFEYDDDTNPYVASTRITNSLGLVTVHRYLDNYRLGQVIQNANLSSDKRAISTYSYPASNSNGPYVTVITSTDPLSNTWTYDWDTHGNMTRVTDPLSRTTRYYYDPTTVDLLKIITATNGLTTTFGYDAHGNLLTIARPITETNQIITTTLGYDTSPPRAGDVLTVTNPLGNSWNLKHDDYGYVISTTNPLAETSLFGHNNVGWLTSATSPRGYTSTFTYTTYGEPQTVTDTLGYTTVFTYDNVGNLINARDANGHIITNTYDLDNELTRATRPDNTHSDYGYDSLGRTITQTNELGQLTQYSYDNTNRVITYTDALARSTISQFNLAGNLSSVTDAKGQTTTLGYDAAYQLSSVNYSDGTTPNVSYLYNNLGMRTVMTDGTGTSTYSYDSLNRLTQAVNGHADAITYTYDIASRPITITYPYNGSSTRNVVRGYNNANELTSVKDWLNNTSNFGYNADGALTSITRPNGANTYLTYDNADQVITKTDAITATPFLSFTFQIDPVGVLASTAEDNTSGSVGTHTYNYDTRYRLTQDVLSTTPVTNTWQYDAATQILTTTYQSGGAGTPINGVRTFDAANQIKSLIETQGATTLKQLSYAFDNNGNRTQRKNKIGSTTTNYAYDQADRLTTYNVGPFPTTYGYNGDGLRMTKTGTVSTNQYSWDVGVEAGLPLLLQEVDATTNGSYVYGPGGMLLEEVVPGAGPGSYVPYYYHTDRIGSVRALTSSSGAVSNTYTYDAYGKPLSSTGSVANPFGYTGEYTDQESGFVYLRARYYDPESQQFLTVDPALAWTEQAYAYVGGTPTNFADPTGLWVDPPGPCGHSYYGRCTGGGSSSGSWGTSVPGPVATREPPVPTPSSASDGGLWGGICAFFTHPSDPEETERKLLEAASMGPAITVIKGSGFRSHWSRHKQLIRREDGQPWNKWDNGEGDDFVADLQAKIESGYFKYEGLGGWTGPGAPDTYALIYKSETEILALRQNGEFWTLLRIGRDMAERVEIYIKPGEDD